MTKPIPVPDILARRSIRKFTNQPVSEEQIEKLLQAAMAAPSGSNRKPWHFVVVTERETLDRLVFHQYSTMLREATLCIAVCGDPAISADYWVQDCTAATENVLLAAVGMGLGGVWLGVHPKSDGREVHIREVLGIPEEIVPLNLLAIGHPAEEKPARTQYDGERVHREGW